MSVFWFERSNDAVPAHRDWLSAAEQIRLGTLRFPKRRADWLLGRWTAKCAVAAVLNEGLAFADIEICAAPSGAPSVRIRNDPAALKISLSHRVGIACCAITLDPIAVGCDLELVEPRIPAFVSDYFTGEECELIARSSPGERTRLIALLWSAKESTLKTLGVGLRADTRSVSVIEPHEPSRLLTSDPGWRRLITKCPHGELCGWWQSFGELVRTVVCGCGPGFNCPAPKECAVP
jgi:4'-phosphopantetheinyl transferase